MVIPKIDDIPDFIPASHLRTARVNRKKYLSAWREGPKGTRRRGAKPAHGEVFTTVTAMFFSTTSSSGTRCASIAVTAPPE